MSVQARKRVAVHPGEILEDYLNDYDLSQSELSRRLFVPIGNINEICRGKRGISPQMAVKLSKFFRTTPDLWLNLQKNWELSRIDDKVAAEIEPVKFRA